MCRQGASVIQAQVLDQVADASLRVYVAWVQILPDDRGAAADECGKLVTDTRTSHFWDADKALPPLFAHHQLGELDLAPKLDGEAFARQLRELL